jgi:hypothetical protein
MASGAEIPVIRGFRAFGVSFLVRVAASTGAQRARRAV